MANEMEKLIIGRVSRNSSKMFKDEQGRLHNEFGPAIEHSNGDKGWFYHGCISRAIVDGSDYYFQNGKFHREGAPAIKYSSGQEEWMIEGKAHRLDGPSQIMANGRKAWAQNDKLHREDGPALTFPEGGGYYYFDDVKYPDIKNDEEWLVTVNKLKSGKMN